MASISRMFWTENIWTRFTKPICFFDTAFTCGLRFDGIRIRSIIYYKGDFL